MARPLALIIEDHIDAATIFSEALRSAGFETEIIRSGDIAMKRLDSLEPDMVILDLNLPKVSGSEILQKIRAEDRLAETCVIVATAHPQMADGGVHRGADMVLLKPISFTQLRGLAARLGSDQTPTDE